MSACATEYRVLGAIEAVRNGEALALGGLRQQALLALLLLHPGRAVGADQLAEEVWHGNPPSGAATTIRVYISRLRTSLTDAVISRSDAGYAIGVHADCVDAHRFERLVAEGREAVARGAAGRAVSRFDEALELWRGRPFGSLADDGALALEAKRLEELHILALEDRIEAALQLGRDAELVDELEKLLDEHPYRERLWRHLMLALYRAGRQADALAGYRRARTLLDDELGIEPGPELRALEQAILQHEVPKIEAPEERHNLPAPLTSFVGRRRELAELRDLLERSRLVTLTGIGGVGKTRLALEVARELVPDFSDGVYFVDLGLVADPALVPTQVARSLELQEHAGTPLIDLLLHRLRETQLLLVLDNCEHVTQGCAQLTAALLESCPRLHVLMTSREPLGVFGEFEFQVLPLGVPSGDDDPDEARASEAVHLFLERARAVRQRPDDDTAVATAGRICRDLEGLPLAIELAAARTKALSLDEISERLSDRFRFLVSWRRLATARHRTLREAIDWSYELLAPAERSLLRQASVFGGGFRLSAAADICLGGDEERALTLVERLVDASLLNPEEADAATRYRLLETVREYAAGRLREAGEENAVKSAHARYYLELAERQGPTSSASL
jgi:predicted ATPase/DNA-binding SARP family transcriptional activator